MAKQYTCEAQGCEFVIQSENEDEIVDMVERHARDTHGMSMERSDIRSGMQTV